QSFIANVLIPFGTTNPSNAFNTTNMAGGSVLTPFNIAAGTPGAGIGRVNGDSILVPQDNTTNSGTSIPTTGANPLYDLGGPDLMVQQQSTQGFQLLPSSSIHGFKFDDLNADGVYQTGEPALPGVQFQLFDSNN